MSLSVSTNCGALNGPGATVQRYVEGFNAANADVLADCFADDGVILDGMAPHVWSGSTATRDWHRDAMEESAHLGISDFHMTLGVPTHDAVMGEAAYFVAPATLSFTVGGKPIEQTGALFTVALRNVEGRWLIAAWAWTKGAGGGTDDVKQAAV